MKKHHKVLCENAFWQLRLILSRKRRQHFSSTVNKAAKIEDFVTDDAAIFPQEKYFAVIYTVSEKFYILVIIGNLSSGFDTWISFYFNEFLILVLVSWSEILEELSPKFTEFKGAIVDWKDFVLAREKDIITYRGRFLIWCRRRRDFITRGTTSPWRTSSHFNQGCSLFLRLTFSRV